MEFTLSNALSELYSGEKYVITNSDYSTLVWNSEKTKPTLKELETKRDQMQSEYDSKQYQRDRAVAYDPIPEQLDQIYHDMDGWKAKVKAVKDKYPKPTE